MHAPTSHSPHVTIICGTNRPDARSLAVAQAYATGIEDLAAQVLNWKAKVRVLGMHELPTDFLNKMWQNDEELDAQIRRHISWGQFFVFVIPEYNGTYPGILKAFIDAVDPKMFEGKKAAIVGVSEGRTGNLRGNDHLAAVLNHLKINVYHNQVKLSGIAEFIKEDGTAKPEVVQMLSMHSDGYLRF